MDLRRIVSSILRNPFARSTDTTVDELLWQQNLWSVPSVSGIAVNQQTALASTAVLACVTILAEDIAKLPWTLNKKGPRGEKVEATSHWLYQTLRRPNDWQNDFEFREMMMVSLLLRGNAYAVIIWNNAGKIDKLIPVNADWVALWEAPDGELFYRVTPQGLHMRAQLAGEPFLIPFSDMLHIRGISLNGLMGVSKIGVAKEAVGLSVAYEQQASRWMGNAAKPAGLLQTDQKLTPGAAERIANDWKTMFAGLQNSGKTAILEQGLKFARLDMTSADLEFIASRKFQLEEIARVWRVPLHMIASLDQSTMNNVTQQAQEYINNTLMGYSRRWSRKIEDTFDLDKEGISLDFDFRLLMQADMTGRVNNWRTQIMSMIATPDEARIDLGLPPLGGEADELHYPANMAVEGSQSSGTGADGGGRPGADEPAGGDAGGQKQQPTAPKPKRTLTTARRRNEQ